MTSAETRFKAAIAAFDAANADDPNSTVVKGMEYPKELVYAHQMTRWLEHLVPAASEALRLAARCQHIRRWAIPRRGYPMDRPGYLRWRRDLQNFHAEVAGEIMAQVGYDDATIARVRAMVRKERLKQDPEVQALEDVICLVFLENYFADFAKRHEAGKITDIVAKTWKKMSPAGREAALALELPDEARALVEQALAGMAR